MITNVKADGNVPFQANRPRYNIVGTGVTLIKQIKASGSGDFNGKRAKTLAQTNPALLDPTTVGKGQAIWTNLSDAGLFYLGGPQARPLVIEGVVSKNCTPTFKIVAMDDPNIDTGTPPAEVRPWPTTFPIRLGANECVMVTTTGASGAAEVGFLVRLDGTKIV